MRCSCTSSGSHKTCRGSLRTVYILYVHIWLNLCEHRCSGYPYESTCAGYGETPVEPEYLALGDYDARRSHPGLAGLCSGVSNHPLASPVPLKGSIAETSQCCLSER